LHAVSHRKVQMDVCDHCGGVWLDAGELERILKKSRQSGVLDAVGEVAPDVLSELVSGAGDLAGDALGAVFEFLGEALSGLGP
jgi:hypothetical protein